MAFSFFRKKDKPVTDSTPAAAEGAGGGADNGESNGSKSTGKGNVDAYKPDPRKAKAWFDRGRTVAATDSHDYAIDCFTSGLKFEPDNMDAYEALYEIAKRRKVGGGKPPGMFDRVGGKTPVEKLVSALALWAKDFTVMDRAITVMERAAEANRALPEVDLAEVIYWAGERALEVVGANKKLSKAQFIKIRDLFHEIAVYDKAIEACRRAVALDEDNPQLLQDLKDLEAEHSMQKAKYGESSKESIKDTTEQRKLEQMESISITETQLDQLIAQLRAEHEEAPEDLPRMEKLVEKLRQRATDASEAEATKLLQAAWQRTGQYRYKMMAGDVKMRQLGRKERETRTALAAAPGDAALKTRVQEIFRQRLQLELAEYEERVKNYPTDLRLKFEYGKRLFAAHKFEEAIPVLQEARAEPKNRAPASLFLGRSFTAMGWLDNAIQTLREGKDKHELADDDLGLDLRYFEMDALEKSAVKNRRLDHAREALEVAQQIIQAKFGYRDIRERVERLRKLIEELQQNKGEA